MTDTRQAGVFLYRNVNLLGEEFNVSTATDTELLSPNGHELGPDRRGRKSRDDRRRVTHNEVERRRRDKINSWIMKLGSIIPDTCEATHKHGPADGLSKGKILAAGCEYIGELNETVARLQRENERLREVLQRHGIPCDDDNADVNANVTPAPSLVKQEKDSTNHADSL